MSREINPEKLDDADLAYIAQRPWIAEELKRQGYDLENLEKLEDVEDEEDDEPVNYHDWNVDELRNELAGRELPTSGKKDELIARLEENDQA